MEETDTTEIAEEKTLYEIMLLLAPNLAEKDLEKNLDEVKEIINSNGGEIVNEDIWGIRDLAYRIKKHDTGFYAVYNFNLPPEKIREFNPILNINHDVLKYLISKTPKFYEFKTRDQYEAEAEAEKKELEEAEKEKEKEKERKKSATPTPKAKKDEDKGLKEIPKEEVEKKEEVKEEPVKEVVICGLRDRECASILALMKDPLNIRQRRHRDRMIILCAASASIRSPCDRGRPHRRLCE